MTTKLKLMASVTAAALLSGCGGGGGGGGGVQDLLGVMICGPLGLPADCGQRAQALNAAQAAAAAQSQSTPPLATFSKWSDHQRSSVQATGPEVVMQYDATGSSIRPGSQPAVFTDGSVTLYNSGAGYSLQSFYSQNVSLGYGYALAGQPGLERLARSGSGGYGNYDFSDLWREATGVFANPYTLGWEYQAFGAWASGTFNSRVIGANSYGAVTPGLAVPTSGTANFSGKLGGLYISPTGEGSMAAADLSVNANFNTRSLSLSSTGTTITRDISTATAAPHLNVSGTLNYSAGSSAFTGTLANTGGTMSGTTNGRFYGPAAQELGGVFAIKSPTNTESLVGAYGAKR